MIPKVKFIYSPIYDMVVLELKTGLKKYDEKVFGKISRTVWDRKRIDSRRVYSENLQSKWDRISAKALKAMADVSGFEWKDQLIRCYLMDAVQSFSDPMTIRFSGDLEDDIESVLHEMGHNLERGNWRKVDWDSYYKRFGKENQSVKHHILLHAILKLAYLKAFGPAKTKKYLSYYKDLPWSYHRAWELVDQYGAESLVNDFIKK